MEATWLLVAFLHTLHFSSSHILQLLSWPAMYVSLCLIEQPLQLLCSPTDLSTQQNEAVFIVVKGHHREGASVIPVLGV